MPDDPFTALILALAIIGIICLWWIAKGWDL